MTGTDPIRPEEQNPGRNRERLNDLSEDIAEQRENLAEEQGTNDEQRFVDSGTVHPELDDQTIAPPG